MEVAAFPEVLTMGGDCRLTLNAKGLNKYHCMPKPMERALFRGSCTCNIPTPEAFQAAEATYAAIKNEQVSHPPSWNCSIPNRRGSSPSGSRTTPATPPDPNPRIFAFQALPDPAPARSPPTPLDPTPSAAFGGYPPST